MSFVKFLPHAAIIAVLAAILQYAALVPSLMAYLVAPAIFQTWALYFLAGAKPIKGVQAVACGIAGVLAAMLIVVLGTNLVPLLGAHWAFTLACMAVAFLCILMERVPPLDFIPAYFIGAGIFFLLPDAGMGFKLIQCVIILFAGFGLGYLTVLFRGQYATLVTPPVTAAAPATAESRCEPELVGK